MNITWWQALITCVMFLLALGGALAIVHAITEYKLKKLQLELEHDKKIEVKWENTTNHPQDKEPKKRAA